jgi:hypothetical protein
MMTRVLGTAKEFLSARRILIPFLSWFPLESYCDLEHVGLVLLPVGISRLRMSELS